MSRSSRSRPVLFAGWAFLAALFVGTASAAVPANNDPAQMLSQADSIKTTDHVEFTQLIQRLDRDAMKLTAEQQWHLRYLDAWQAAYIGDYETATSLLNEVMTQSTDATLRFRAGVTSLNMLGIGRRYEDAFSRLNQLLDQLPRIIDEVARFQLLGEAAQLFTAAGQYDLASGYADQMLKEIPTGESACKGMYFKLDARYRSGKLQTLDQPFLDGLDVCVKAGETLVANAIRADMAAFYIHHGRAATAIKLLQKNYSDVQRVRYQSLISQIDALLAQAYWKEGESALAKQFALKAVGGSIKHEYTEPLTNAYGLLYQIAQRQGDAGAALAWHEKYMAADKGYLNDVSAKALAYQVVKQQVEAKKLQLDTLGKQNQILHLQQALSKKAAETSRLYIILLLLVLASIAVWSYRVKRSQLRFMGQARRDGMTGIFNRQHFISMAEQQLQRCRKAGRAASLLLIDLDHFKIVNDTHGHAMGDLVLQRAVEACQAHLRAADVFGRLGGEEFGILLPACAAAQATERAEQLRLAIAGISAGDSGVVVRVSASFGVACSGGSGHDLRQLLVDADLGLYRAKRAGRNQVSVAINAEACPEPA